MPDLFIGASLSKLSKDTLNITSGVKKIPYFKH